MSAGDSVLFRKGQTWREQLAVPSSGIEGHPITFGAYGTGDYPIISPSLDFGQFSTVAESNLLTNGSFETFTGTEDDGVVDTITNWDNGYIVTVADANLDSIPDGTHALMLYDNGTNNAIRRRYIPVTAGKWYVLRATMISDGTGTIRFAIKQENGQGLYNQLAYPVGESYRMFDSWGVPAIYRDICAASDTA